jgi:hypothetical protein
MFSLFLYYLRAVRKNLITFVVPILFICVLCYIQKSAYVLVALVATLVPIFVFSETASDHSTNIMFEKLLPIQQTHIVASKYIVLLLVVLSGFGVAACDFLFMSYLDTTFNLYEHLVFLMHITSIAVNFGIFITILSFSNKQRAVLFMLSSLTSLVSFLPMMHLFIQADLSNIELLMFKISEYLLRTPATYDLMLSSVFVIFSYPLAVYLQQRKVL